MNIIKSKKNTGQEAPSREVVIAEFKKLHLQKLQAGLDGEAAENIARQQIEQNYGSKVATSALSGVHLSRPSDPFAGMNLADVFAGVKPPPTVEPKPIVLPPNFRRLVMEKRKAGLDREQAELVIRAQIENDTNTPTPNK